ncbi:MAG: hypothetical protein ACPGXL_09345, partial [Chitinophagales bacterium]
KPWAIGIGLFLFLLFAAQVVLLMYLSPIVKHTLIQAVQQKTNNTYALELEDFNLNVFNGNINIKNLNLEPLPAYYQDTTLQKNLPILDIAITDLQINGINTLRSLWTKQLKIRNVLVNQAEVVYSQTKYFEPKKEIPESGTKENETVSSNPLSGILADYLEQIEIQQIDLAELALQQNQLDSLGNNREVFSLQEANLLLQDILVNNTIPKKTAFSLGEMVVRLKDFNYNIPQTDFIVQAGLFIYSRKKAHLQLQNVAFRNDTMNHNRAAFDLKIPEIVLTQFDILESLAQRTLQLDTLLIRKAQIELISNRKERTVLGSSGNRRTSKTNKTKPSSTVLVSHKDSLQTGQIPTFEALKIKAIKIVDAELEQLNQQTNTKLGLERINIAVTDIESPLAKLATDYLYMFNDFYFDAQSGTWDAPQSNYAIKMGRLSGKRNQGLLNVTELEVKPKRTQQEMLSNNIPNLVDMNMGSLVCSNVDWEELLETQSIIIGEIGVKDLNVHIFRDKAVPVPSKYHPMPQEAILGVNKYFDIGTLTVENSEFKYEEKHESALGTGELSFNDMRIIMENLTNTPSKKDVLLVNVQGAMMGEGLLDVGFAFDLTDPNYGFIYEATLTNLNLTRLNNMVEPAADILIESGRVNKMHFVVDADAKSANGAMNFLYNDLQIQFKDKETGTTNRFKSKALGFLAHALVIKENNPRRSGTNPVVGEIHFDRDQQKSFFHYIWNALFSGIVECLGIDDLPEKTAKGKELVRKLKAQKDEMVSNLQEGKEQRQNNRAIRKAERQQERVQTPETGTGTIEAVKGNIKKMFDKKTKPKKKKG